MPGVDGGLGAAIPGDLADEPGDLGRHQPAVLVTPLVRLSLDVQDDPAGLRVAITGTKPLHGGRVGPEWFRAGTRVGTAGLATADPAANTIKPVNTNRVQVGMIILGGAGWPLMRWIRTLGRSPARIITTLIGGIDRCEGEARRNAVAIDSSLEPRLAQNASSLIGSPSARWPRS